jgi:hypothetical protein
MSKTIIFRTIIFRTIIAFLLLHGVSSPAAVAPPWTVKQANDWYAHQPWLVGSNFIPSTAINELEMWQADTFDLPTIDRELGWAQTLGMNTMRVFLHNLLWKQDSAGFLRRMDQFLEVAANTIFASCLFFSTRSGILKSSATRRDPKPHVHNPGAAPGGDAQRRAPLEPELKPYITGVIGHFRDDPRVLMWDLMNEPDNENGSYKAQELPNKAEVAVRLLKEEWSWARSVKPTQPLTSGVWRGEWGSDDKLSEMASLQLQNSDVSTFHSYEPPDEMKRRIGRPIVVWSIWRGLGEAPLPQSCSAEGRRSAL